MIRVVVVDDHKIVREGIIAYLNTDDEIEVIGEAGSGYEGAEVVKKTTPDVVLMDLKKDNGDGVEATRLILEELPDCKIIILTSYYDDEEIFRAIDAGVFIFLLKTSSAFEIA